MRFTKLHGYGNDYLVFEARELAGVGAADDAAGAGSVRMGAAESGPLNEFVRAVCERHFGAGADGVALVEPAHGEAADFRVRIFNHDGSEAAMSGNGTRCAASYLYFHGLWAREELRLDTRAGVKLYRLLGRPRAGRFRFEAEIGRPRFESAAIPMRTGEELREVRGHPLTLAPGETVEVTALQMCNPNCCVFVEDFERFDWRRAGRLIESHEQFPERTNVEFVRVRDRQNVEVRVWERGVGETLSSGTGACAAAVAACVNGLTERRVRVEMPGGLLEVRWGDDGEVLLTGEAEVVYQGEWVKGRGQTGKG